jgi:hypothetical protein
MRKAFSFVLASGNGRSLCRLAMLAMAIFATAWRITAQAAEDGPFKANTSRAAREEAVRAIPFNRLTPDARAKIAAVVQNVSIYRRLPMQSIGCDPELYSFLVKHPDVVVNIWHVMGITKMQLEPISDRRFKVADGEGTKGQMEYLFASPEMNVIYSEGTYDGPLYPRTVRGKCLMVLRTDYRRDVNGRYATIAQLDTFLAVENLGVEVLAKTFQPLVGRAADHNFAETANFVTTLSRTAETNEPALLRLCRKLDRVDAKTRSQFMELVSAVPQKLAAAEIEAASATDLVRNAKSAAMRE